MCDERECVLSFLTCALIVRDLYVCISLCLVLCVREKRQREREREREVSLSSSLSFSRRNEQIYSDVCVCVKARMESLCEL